MAAQGQNALVQRINEKLALLNQRADQIRGISTANQEAVAQVVPRVTAIKDRIVSSAKPLHVCPKQKTAPANFRW